MSLNAAATALTSERPRIAPPRVRARFHVWLGLWMLAIVVIGFWPTYFSPLLRGTLTIPTVVHTHALVFLGWMALLMAQVIVAAGGNIRLHRRIGRWGIAYGCVVIVMGLIVGPANAVIKFNSGVWTRDEAARSLLVTVGDMVSFGLVRRRDLVSRAARGPQALDGRRNRRVAVCRARQVELQHRLSPAPPSGCRRSSSEWCATGSRAGAFTRFTSSGALRCSFSRSDCPSLIQKRG